MLFKENRLWQFLLIEWCKSMGHKGKLKKNNSYINLQQRLDKAPQGAPPSKALFDIL